MHVEALKIFCDLVDTQSFAKAATLNSVTQSAVSQQLKSLENRTQKVLLERHKRALVPTAAGEIFYLYAREIARSYDTMQGEMDALHGVISGTIRMACIYSFGMTELGPYVRTFLKAHPDVRLLLDYDTSRGIFKKVAQGDADLGIATALRAQKNVTDIPYRLDPLVVICGRENAFAENPEPLPIAALDKKPFIAFEEGSHTRELLDRLFRKHRVYPHMVMALNHVSMVKHAVEQDLGVAIISLHAVRAEIGMGMLVARALEGIALTRPLSLLHRAGRRLPMSVQALIQTLKGPPSADA